MKLALESQFSEVPSPNLSRKSPKSYFYSGYLYFHRKYSKLYPFQEIVSNEGIGLISVGLDGSVGAMKPLKGYDVTQVRELNGIREKVRSRMHYI